jgi:hypothetical protein
VDPRAGADVIRRECKVSLSAVSVGRLLRTLGLSPQRRLWRAWQADPDAVQRWKDEQFPAIRAEAKKVGATVYFGDEAGVPRATTPAPPEPRSARPRWSIQGHRRTGAA